MDNTYSKTDKKDEVYLSKHGQTSQAIYYQSEMIFLLYIFVTLQIFQKPMIMHSFIALNLIS